MAASDISRQLRLLLTSSSEAPPLTSFLDGVDSLVAECASSQDSDAILAQLEEDLQAVYHDVIDHSVFPQIKIFLSVLYHLRPILPPLSIISTWFDLVLRRALREPKLSAEAVNYAKELIVSALSPVKQVRDALSGEPEKEKRKEKVKEFRRRLMDLYLLDAYNESSGEDVLEWAEADDAEKEMKACWKANLEDVLVRVGLQRPQVGLVSSVPARCRPHAKRMPSLPPTRICSRSYITALYHRRRGCSCSYFSMHTPRSQTFQPRLPSLRLIR